MQVVCGASPKQFQRAVHIRQSICINTTLRKAERETVQTKTSEFTGTRATRASVAIPIQGPGVAESIYQRTQKKSGGNFFPPMFAIRISNETIDYELFSRVLFTVNINSCVNRVNSII